MKDLIKENFTITRLERNKMNNHRSICIFITGFSGSGKSTLANALEVFLSSKNIRTYCLDGDNIRTGINKNLSFSPDDRSENLRRIGEVAKLFIDSGVVTIASFIAPYQKDRDNIKCIIGADDYFEIHMATSIKVCEKRDVKGLYAKVRKGEIKNFTGIDAPYEIPESPDMRLNTEDKCVEDLVVEVYEELKSKISL